MYVFDNSAPLAADRLKALADVHDASSIRHLKARGVCRGWKCLEIGGGLGTITRWLSERVGPDGYEDFVWRSATLWTVWGQRPEISG